MNTELLSVMLKLIVGCAVIMGLITAASIVTPKLARLIESKYPRLAGKAENPEGVEDSTQEAAPQDYKVTGIFESSKLDDFDPNYKIYNKDIYGVDFKHGKKQKNG